MVWLMALLGLCIFAGLLKFLFDTRAALAAAKSDLKRFTPILDIESEAEEMRRKLSVTQHELEKSETELGLKKEEFRLSLREMESYAHNLKAELKLLTDDSDLLSAGFYKPKYDFGTSDIYETKLEQVRERQKNLIKEKMAIVCSAEWEVGGSRTEGKKMTDRTIKLGLAAFNVQCDNEILSVRFDNVDRAESKISKIRENVDKLLEPNKCRITEPFHKLKLEELFLVYEFREKKQREKEEQRQLKDQMREEEKALREAERAQAEAAREEKQFLVALEKAKKDLEKKSDVERAEYAAKIAELEAKLGEAQEKGQRAKSLAEFTRRGHVYIISNIGSFGEQVFKIGMTRRWDPMDRVWELSDASVPFDFDVHALIFTDDAPGLERKLHEAFDGKRMNRVNGRKEFFKASLDEISAECKRLHQGEIKLTLVAEAKEFRQTLAIMTDSVKTAA